LIRNNLINRLLQVWISRLCGCQVLLVIRPIICVCLTIWLLIRENLINRLLQFWTSLYCGCQVLLVEKPDFFVCIFIWFLIRDNLINRLLQIWTSRWWGCLLCWFQLIIWFLSLCLVSLLRWGRWSAFDYWCFWFHNDVRWYNIDALRNRCGWLICSGISFLRKTWHKIVGLRI
jgi:hypothetical protein